MSFMHWSVAGSLALLAFTAQAETLTVELQGSVTQLQTWLQPISCSGRNCPVQEPARLGEVTTFRGYTLGGDAAVTLSIDTQTLQVTDTSLAGNGLPTGMWNPWAGGSSTGPQARVTGDTLSIDGWLVSGSSADYRFTHELTFAAGTLASLGLSGVGSADVVALAPSRMNGCGDAPFGGCVNAQISWKQAVITAVPEPGTWATFALGLVGVGAAVVRRRRQVASQGLNRGE